MAYVAITLHAVRGIASRYLTGIDLGIKIQFNLYVSRFSLIPFKSIILQYIIVVYTLQAISYWPIVLFVVPCKCYNC